MKKKCNQGFLLVETLVVSTFCLTVLVILFLQFKNLIVGYNTNFKYNTVEGVYNLNTIKKYIQSNDITLNNDHIYMYNENSHNSCNTFCQELVKATHITTLIYTTPSTTFTTSCNSATLSTGLCKFISKLKSDSTKTKRLIAEFDDGSYASITF